MILPAANSKLFARASLFLIGLVCVLPFLVSYHRPPLATFYNEWIAFVLGIAALGVWLQKSMWREMELPVIALFPLFYLLVLLAQGALGLVAYSEQVTVAAYYLVWATCLVVLGAVLRRELGAAKIVTAIAWAILIGAALSAVAALLQHYAPHSLRILTIVHGSSVRVDGNLAQPTQFTCYITLGLASIAYLIAANRIRTFFAASFCVLLLPPLALSGSRSSWFYIAAIVVFAAMLRARNQGVPATRMLTFSAALLPAFLVANWAVGLEFLRTSYDSTTALIRLFGEAHGPSQRLELLRESWWMFLQSPWIGVGFKQFAWFQYKHHLEFGTSSVELDDHAHNILLHVLAETGFIGALVLLAAAGVWLADVCRAKFDLERCQILTLVAIVGLYSLNAYPLWYSYFLGVTAFLLGVGATHRLTLSLERVGQGAAILVMAGAFLIAALTVSAYREFERTFFLVDANSAQPHDTDRVSSVLSRLYRDPLLVPYVDLALVYGVPITRQNARDLLALNTRAMRLIPNSIVIYQQALVLALNGDRDSALRQLDAAVTVYPNELQKFAREVREMSSRYPEQLQPLLETAQSKIANLRAQPATQ